MTRAQTIAIAIICYLFGFFFASLLHTQSYSESMSKLSGLGGTEIIDNSILIYHTSEDYFIKEELKSLETMSEKYEIIIKIHQNGDTIK